MRFLTDLRGQLVMILINRDCITTFKIFYQGVRTDEYWHCSLLIVINVQHKLGNKEMRTP